MRSKLSPAVGVLVVFQGLATQAQPPGSQADEQAIRASAAAYVAAFNAGDLDRLLSYWSEDADYTSVAGKTYRGREVIRELFAKALGELKGAKLTLHIDSLRFLTPDTALEDGSLELALPDGDCEPSRYTAIWTKHDGRWLLRGVRDSQPAEAETTPSESNPLSGLQWLVGDWQQQGEAVEVELSARWRLNNRYLTMEYTVRRSGADELSVVQWIGRDPLSGEIRSWFFDSAGGRGEAVWTRQGNAWKIASRGVLADGRTGESANEWRFIDEHKIEWRMSERLLDGQPLPDVALTFTRKPVR